MGRPTEHALTPEQVELAKELGLDKPRRCQAQRIIDKFGGAAALAKAIDRDVSRVYRWLHPKSKGGSGGVVPSQALQDIGAAARREGVYLTSEDFDPRAL